jgi:hypothetical protein
MEPADLWYGDDLTAFWRVDFSLNRRLSIERKVRPRMMIIVEIIGKNPPQMTLVEYDGVVEALATNRSDESLDVRRLPWRTVCDRDLLDALVLDTLGATQRELASKAGNVTPETSR